MTRPTDPSRRRAERRGRLAEAAAILSYALRLYRPLGTRVRTPVGEIDLVLRRGAQLVFAEVKFRPQIDAAALALSARQKDRIGRAAAWYLARHPHLAGLACRFDVVCVAPWRLPRHVESAFDAPH